MMAESRSDSPATCGLCGGKAFEPERMRGEDPEELDGLFNVCGECGAECTGTGAYAEKDRYYWTGAKQVARGRAAMQAAQDDADRHADRLDDY